MDHNSEHAQQRERIEGQGGFEWTTTASRIIIISAGFRSNFVASRFELNARLSAFYA